jgi:peptide/nickel transport system substrate-binding protein
MVGLSRGKGALPWLVMAVVFLLLSLSVPVTANPTDDTFVEAVYAGYPDSLDPAVESYPQEVVQNVYETLVWYNGPSVVVLRPMLAVQVPSVENGGIGVDGMTYVYELRDDVQFHNGDQLTGEDVVYSIMRLLVINDPYGGARNIGPFLIPGYEGMTYVNESDCAKAIWASGPLTVQFNLTRPCPYFNQIMATPAASIVSKRFVEEHGGTREGMRNPYLQNNTCGTGPYQLSRFRPAEYVALDRFDAYWGQRAEIAHVNITTVYEDTDRLNMISSGAADSAQIPREWESELNANEGVRVVKGDPIFDILMLGLNQNMNLSANPANGTDTVPSDFFADRDVRLAFAYAYNLQSSIDEMYEYGVMPLNGIIPRGMAYYDPSIPYQSFNLFTAAEHLNRAKTGDGDTWGERGFRITLYYDPMMDPSIGQLPCTHLKEGLEALSMLDLVQGVINVTVMPLSIPDLITTLNAHALPLFITGMTAGLADPQEYMSLFLDSEGFFSEFFGIKNLTLDTMVHEAAEEMNATVRAQMYHDISMALQENCYYIAPMQETSFHVERVDVSGYYDNPMHAGLYFADLSYAEEGKEGVDRTYAILGILGLIAMVIVASVLLNRRLRR